MTKKNILTLAITSLLTVPLIVSAETGTGGLTDGFTNVGEMIDTFTGTVVKSLATLFATSAMVAFFYGIVQYIWGLREGKADQVTKGNQFMVWGLVALFVMFSVWGIVQYAQNIFGIKGDNNITIPEIKFQGGNGGAPGSGGGPVAGACALLADGDSCGSGKTCQGGACVAGSTGTPAACDSVPEGGSCGVGKTCQGGSCKTSAVGTTGGNKDGCSSFGATCFNSAGKTGTCATGGDSSDYALFCRETTSSNGGDKCASAPDPEECNCVNLGGTYTNGSCSNGVI